MQGRIIKNISDLYTVKVENKSYICKPRGIFRNKNIIPLVGDLVNISENDLVIEEVLPRKNELHRPSVSNIDIAVIVTSIVQPNINLNLLDKFIVMAEYNNIEPVILLTKMDLVNEKKQKEVNNIMAYYERIGYKVYQNNKLEEFLKYLKNKIVVLTGQTGVGKSTLLNTLNNELNIKTDEISIALGRGKHTTRHTEIYEIKKILFVDTPGFGSLDLQDIIKEDIKNCFIEFKKYDCKFKDCMHVKEIGCGIKKALDDGEILKSRYENYLNFVGDNNEN